MRVLLIYDEKVVGVLVGQPVATAQQNNAHLLVVEDTFGLDVVIGMTYKNGVLSGEPTPDSPPPVRVPVAVTMRQARLALLSAGMLDTADAAIAAMPGIEGQAARIEWEYAHEIRRDSPLVVAMAALLGLDEPALDQLFVAANGL